MLKIFAIAAIVAGTGIAALVPAQAALVPNALVPNALVPNALVPNALIPNAIYPKGIENGAALNGRVVGIEFPSGTHQAN